MSSMTNPGYYPNIGESKGQTKIKPSLIPEDKRAVYRTRLMKEGDSLVKNRLSLNARREKISGMNRDPCASFLSRSDEIHHKDTKASTQMDSKPNYKTLPSTLSNQDRLVESLQSEIQFLKNSLKAKDETIQYLLTKIRTDSFSKSNSRTGNEIQLKTLNSSTPIQPLIDTPEKTTTELPSPQPRIARRKSIHLVDFNMTPQNADRNKNQALTVPIGKMKNFFKKLREKRYVSVMR